MIQIMEIKGVKHLLPKSSFRLGRLFFNNDKDSNPMLVSLLPHILIEEK